MGDKVNDLHTERLERLLEEERLLADAAFEAVGIFDENLRCVAVNRATSEVFGYTEEELLTLSALDLVAEESHADVIKRVKRKSETPYTVYGKRKDGSTFPGEVRGRNTIFKGRPARSSAIRDISRSRAFEEELKSALHELQIIFSNSKVGMLYLQGGRYLKRANQTLADIMGYDGPDEMVGLDMRKFHLTEERFEQFGKRYFNKLREGAQLDVEYRLRRKDGSPIWCSLSGQAVDTNSPADLELGVLWVVDDISKRKAEELRLRKMATTDDLTGALNRKEFFRQVQGLSHQDKRCPTGPSLLMIDLDHFKKINDRFGHEAGDLVLQSFAVLCRETLREDDLFARLGGEEFIAYLPGADLGGAINVAERIRKRVAATEITTLKGDIGFTVSIGAASASSRWLSVEDLIRRADESLYEAKRDGRNRVVFYD